MTKCGYCQLQIKVENLENHCKNVHHKPKLAAGQKTLDNLFSSGIPFDISSSNINPPLEIPALADDMPEQNSDAAPPLAKKQKVDQDISVEVEQMRKETELRRNLESDYREEEGDMIMQDRGIEEEEVFNKFLAPDDKREAGAMQISEVNNNVASASTSVPNTKIDEMVFKIDAIKATVDILKAKTIPDIAKPSDVCPADDRVEKLVMCKELDDILTEFPELSYNKTEELLKCDLCFVQGAGGMGACVPGLFIYSKEKEGDSKNQSLAFRHLKSHLKRHFMKEIHVENWEAWKKAEEAELKFKSRNQSVGLRVARTCYDCYKEGKSLRSFEKEITKAHLNGCDMGELNNSLQFVSKFRPFVAAECMKRTRKYLSTRLSATGFLPPLGVSADKGTTVHTTRQFTTAATVVPGSSSLVNIIYLGQPIVKSHSGEGVANSIVEELTRHSISDQQLESGSFDGQYFHLKVPNHLTNKLQLPPQFFCTWDPLHKIGVMENHLRQDQEFSWLVDLTSTCQQIYKKFNWGKNHQALVEKCELLELRMRSLKTFSTTRFPNSVRAVFDTLIDDYQAVVRCLEDIANNDDNGSEARKRAADARGILRKICSKRFVLKLSSTSDVYEQFGFITNLCQIVDLLPHERYDNVMKAVGQFDKMLECMNHTECVKLQEADKKQKCLWPRYHACLEELKSSKFRRVEIKNDFEAKGFFTKLARRERDLNLLTNPAEITKVNLEIFVKRLSKDIRSEVFEEKTVEMIENTRNVADVKKFALLVKKQGAIQTGLKIGNAFVISSRKITGSVDEISDVEIKDNFCKFLKVLERNIQNTEEKNLDSKTIIKEFLSDTELFSGIELTLHCIITSAVKISVESVVESLVSRYESHFDSSRQMKEEHALEEMLIAENGPDIVNADRLLISAMDRYWKENTEDGAWHFCHKSEDIRSYGKPSKVVQKHLNVQVKFPFMAE